MKRIASFLVAVAMVTGADIGTCRCLGQDDNRARRSEREGGPRRLAVHRNQERACT